MVSCTLLLAFLFMPSNSLSHIEHSLKQSYQKQVRAIRNYYSDLYLRYDATGALIGNGHPGPWTLAYVLIESLKLNQDELEIRGGRVGVELKGDPHQSGYVATNEIVRIEIAIPPGADEDSVRNAIEHVFYPLHYISIPDLPDYWHDVLADNLMPLTNAADPGRHAFRSGCPSGLHTDAPPTIDPSGTRSMVCGGVTIYRVNKGVVTPPRALRTDDPKYTEEARLAKYQASTLLWVMVDATGQPQLIRIARPVGMGLDDAAVEAVRHWQFEPAELNGQPVAVEINVEVNFRLR